MRAKSTIHLCCTKADYSVAKQVFVSNSFVCLSALDCSRRQPWRSKARGLKSFKKTLTGLVRLNEISPSHYFLCKNSDVFIWEPGQPGWPGWKYFNCAYLNGRLAASVAVPWLICPIFHFKSVYYLAAVIKLRQLTELRPEHDRNKFTWRHLSFIYSRRLAPFFHLG